MSCCAGIKRLETEWFAPLSSARWKNYEIKKVNIPLSEFKLSCLDYCCLNRLTITTLAILTTCFVLALLPGSIFVSAHTILASYNIVISKIPLWLNLTTLVLQASSTIIAIPLAYACIRTYIVYKKASYIDILDFTFSEKGEAIAPDFLSLKMFGERVGDLLKLNSKRHFI